MPARPIALLPLLALLALLLGGCGREAAPPPMGASGDGAQAELVRDLRDGGHVLVLRHTTTESTTDRVEVVGDCGQQRNLNAQGRQEARELGAALRVLDVPVGEVRTSPLCRTRETALLAFGRAREDDDLISPGVIGTEADDTRRAERLRELAATAPREGNTVLVTHTGTIGGAFGVSLLEGEALVFEPQAGEDGGAGPEPVGRLRLEDLEALSES
jgi:broad specificity phosphatase PhoE